MQILVVDDNRDTADALAWLLQSIGHQARAAYDGPAALLAAERHSPDVTRDALLVAVTGNPPPDALRAAKEAGFDHLLVKPLGLPALEELLAACALK
jgi:two-component system, OmpR family, response regulator